MRDAAPHAMPERRLRLFCFPYAGRGGSIYRGWNDELSATIEVRPVTLPGREHRLAEPAFDDVLALAAAMAGELSASFEPPFAFFGHSMGALLAFELARHLRRSGRPGPACLAVSAHRAPQIPKDEETTYDKPTDEFLAELRRLDGTPAEVLDHSELLDLILPVLRADFKAVESYRYDEEPPLACPIVAYGGTLDDEIPKQHIMAWRDQTRCDFCARMFDGGHFYVNARRDEVIAQLGSDLLRFCRPGDADPRERLA
jgi:medium-chain acyl-[acyl-carrier-protein] hydrolase